MRGYRPQIALGEIADVDDSGKQQTVSHHGFAGEQHSEVYRPQSFGLSSRPPKGATGIVVSLGGERNRSVFLGGEHDDHRPTGLEEGQSVVYDTSGNRLEFKTDGGVVATIAKGDHAVAVKKGKFAVTVDEKDVTVETKQGKVTVTSKGDVKISSDGHVYVATQGNVYLGASSAAGCYAVATSVGYSTKVFAKV